MVEEISWRGRRDEKRCVDSSLKSSLLALVIRVAGARYGAAIEVVYFEPRPLVVGLLFVEG